ncbi:hypothetical protein LWI29_030046 [Acer saccharum]|uniref:Retrotransposon protein n=1 Tax=Acer saccharum TaxID=4024 RepID=A0AA39SPB6_ACESA|nr:hypothetical protein LWI29_030046 [Acer saccharum]
MMNDKIPSCKLRAQPHIDSCIKLLKKQYHAISEMLRPSASGFWWNDDLKCVVVEKIVFDEWVKSHPTAKSLRNKLFPYYKELGTVFGKDHANGQGAMGFSETVEEIGNEDDQHNDDDPFYPSDELNGNVNMSSTNTPLTQSTDGATRRLKVFDELKKIDGMTNAQLLVHDQANIDNFFTLDEEFKLDFLLSLLE